MRKLTPLAAALVAASSHAAVLVTETQGTFDLYRNGIRLKSLLSASDCKAAAIAADITTTFECRNSVVLKTTRITWTKIADEGSTMTLAAPQVVRYGSGSAWVEKALVAGPAACATATFGGVDPLVGVVKQCQLRSGPPVVIVPPVEPPADHHAGITVDTSSLPTFQPGVPDVRLSAPGAIPPLPAAGDWEADGAFRLLCNPVKMSFDDAIVYPGQPGKAHHHTFFGNTSIDAFTTSANIRSKGNASCRGGTVNLSSYWVPSMIDTATNKPVAPNHLLIYYKTGSWQYFNDGSTMSLLPLGLKMIAGDATRATPGGLGEFSCLDVPAGTSRPGTVGSTIPTTCSPGDEIWGTVTFPQCWDGINLDSPDHRGHMSYPIAFWTGDPLRQYRCPSTHPKVLPQIKFIVQWAVPASGDTSKWRLASDVYSGPGGYSFHGDWFNGWDQAISDLWGVECMRKRRNCGSAQLGDGREMLEFQGN